MITNELMTSAEAMALEDKYGAHNYHPLPVVLTRGEGVFVWDVEGNRYYDFLAAYSAVNQGHAHPRIVKALQDQAARLPLTSRAFYSDKLGECEKYLCEYFGYDKALMMNSGAEANETAIKLARKWGYEVKGIEPNKAEIIAVEKNFHGRTSTIISASTDPVATTNFGPFMPGFNVIEYNNFDILEEAISRPNVCAFWVEPIQGEAGIFIPDEGYLKKVAELCKKYNVLTFIDEIQSGLGRAGKMLASEYEGIRPDLLILGKALSGGVYPVSAVMADDEVMSVLKPGEHGSTYGGNPLACAVTMEALQVLKDENLVEKSYELGEIFRARLQKLVDEVDVVKVVRGRGLMNALEIEEDENSETAWNICLKLKENGLIAKPTHGNIIRFTPPLVMTEEQIHECCDIIDKTVRAYIAEEM